jgi:hypothetical protein
VVHSNSYKLMKMQKREKEGRTEKIKPQKQAILILQ